MPDGETTAAVVGIFTLKLRKNEFDGAPVWSVDDGPEGPTAEGVLAAAGALLDSGVAQIPGYGWRDR